MKHERGRASRLPPSLLSGSGGEKAGAFFRNRTPELPVALCLPALSGSTTCDNPGIGMLFRPRVVTQ